MPRRLIAVHAHPDDESISAGGMLARCSDSGIGTCLVTCTDGRYGPINPDLGLALSPDGLATRRMSELRQAATTLGVERLETLGFHDSGMTGSDTNTAQFAFWSQPMHAVLEVLAGIVRSFKPHVAVTYDAFGATGHPDHIQAHRMTLAAVEAAADERVFPAAGPAWRVNAIYYPVFPLSEMERFIADELAAGRPHPMGGKSIGEINYLRPDELATHRVNIREVYSVKRDALHAHQTQVGPHYPQMYRAALARTEYEHFQLAHIWGPQTFADLFEPVAP